jgi:hypothetical protein
MENNNNNNGGMYQVLFFFVFSPWLFISCVFCFHISECVCVRDCCCCECDAIVNFLSSSRSQRRKKKVLLLSPVEKKGTSNEIVARLRDYTRGHFYGHDLHIPFLFNSSLSEREKKKEK